MSGRRYWHVRVEPDHDEAQRVTAEQADAARAYLKERVADGRYARCVAFARTGGYIELYADRLIDVVTGLDDYPLRETITLHIDEVAADQPDASLDEGFAVLAHHIAHGTPPGWRT